MLHTATSIVVNAVTIVGGILILSVFVVGGSMIIRSMVKWFYHLLRNYRNAPSTMVSTTEQYQTDDWFGGGSNILACGCDGNVSVNWYPRERRLFSSIQLGWSICGTCGDYWVSKSTNKSLSYRASGVYSPSSTEQPEPINNQTQTRLVDGSIVVTIATGMFAGFSCTWETTGTIVVRDYNRVILHTEEWSGGHMAIGDSAIFTTNLPDNGSVVFDFLFEEPWSPSFVIPDDDSRVALTGYLTGTAPAVMGSVTGLVGTTQRHNTVPHPLCGGLVPVPTYLRDPQNDTDRLREMLNARNQSLREVVVAPKEPPPPRVRGRKLDLG